MKVIITESQLVKIIKEDVHPSYMDYMNRLLDKMSSGEPLSQEEKDDMLKLSKGEMLDEPEGNQESNTYSGDLVTSDGDVGKAEMFMEVFPDGTEVQVENDFWMIQKETSPDSNKDILLIMNGDIAIEIEPFYDGSKFKVKTEGKSFFANPQSLPETYDEMEIFVKEFLERDVKQIIEYLY